eukprot:CAMPEP_0184871172 /NCGR_PEP_ID=MMETSP0580-20130426/40261_1 /TAXON_ID=1118495 /ORGANISM="Dactyliosolen fragilissimus" /LENGTH=104 /DNA_ID=CAMNT_0027373737 /DNA_START=1 /DNA_END=312 /DNA_ORIENTATION=+
MTSSCISLDVIARSKKKKIKNEKQKMKEQATGSGVIIDAKKKKETVIAFQSQDRIISKLPKSQSTNNPSLLPSPSSSMSTSILNHGVPYPSSMMMARMDTVATL